MQNSNYFVETATGKFVLTLFERIAPDELAVYLAMQAYLADRGIPCPLPNQPRSPPRFPSGATEARLATAGNDAGLRRTSSSGKASKT